MANEYTFDQIAINSKDKKKPEQSDFPVYLGLENLDAENLHVTRFNKDAMPSGEKLIMCKGDVLFGKRRAYQKKVAIAPFDGIFSAHGMVLRPKSDVVDTDFFPFFISSDYFLDRAISISVGSLSPTVNWGDLKIQKFNLPPLDGQRKLAKLLWKIDSLEHKYRRLIDQCDELIKAQFVEKFGDPVKNPNGWHTKSLLEMGTCKNGMNFHCNDSGVEIHCLGVGDFQEHISIFDTSILPKVSLKEIPSEEYFLHDNDIVFVRSNGNKSLVGRSVVVYPKDTPTIFSGFCIRYRNHEKSVSTVYLIHALRTDSIKNKLSGRGANIQNLNQKMLASLAIPLPPLSLQKEFAAFVQQVNQSKESLKTTLSSLQAVKKNILQSVFA